MSRVGKKPIPIPKMLNVTYEDRVLVVKGEKGVLQRGIHPSVDLTFDDETIFVTIKKDNRTNRALQGMTRSLISNMIAGLDKGFERILEINGIGYRATMKDNCITLNLGYSHPIDFELPDGIFAAVDKNNVIRLSGIDKEKLGHTAAAIRRLRPPEPYKGKGIKYSDEHIKKKAGKTGTK